jgi:hypothetical protein
MSNLPNLDQPNSKPPRNIYGAKRRIEPELQDEPIGAALRRTDGTLRQISPSPPLHEATGPSEEPPQDPRPDPAPSAPAVAEERAQQLITNISSQMLGELRSLREQIDDLMRDMNERRDMIREAIRSHAEFAESAIQHKMIIADSVAKLRAEFESSRTPLPPVRNI